MKRNRLYKESSETPEFVNSDRLRKEIKEVLEEETSGWDGTDDDSVQYMKDSAPDFIDEYVEDVVDDAVKSFNELVHRNDTSMWGNFKDIRYNWEGFHNELPHGCTLKEVVKMIDAGEDNEITREFKNWAVDWYFEAFGTYNLKYKWSEFMGEVAADHEYQQERDAEDEGEYNESCRKIHDKRKVVKESYEVSDDLADRLNSILADEFLAAEFYKLAELAMKGNKQHRLSEIADENGEDELEDHFKNLSEWMQSKGIRVVTNHDEMLDITNGSVFTVEDGDSTSDIVDKLIQSEEEAIEAYENLIPDTDLDLRVMLCGFLKDEREHLKALTDAKDEMGGGSRYDGEDKPKHTIYEGGRMSRHEVEPNYEVYKAVDIQWDVDDEEDLDELPTEMEVEVPRDVIRDGEEAVEEYVSDAITDETGFCHNGFYLREFSKPVRR